MGSLRHASTGDLSRGARLAFLQVMANNEPALALQRKYGFSESYRYWYRVQPFADLEGGNC